MREKIIVRGGSVVLPDAVVVADVEVIGGRIERIGQGLEADASCTVLEARDKYVLPGFIDLHTNGIAGFDLTQGVYDPRTNSFDSRREAYIGCLDKALKEYAKTGVTRAFLTSIAAPVQSLKNVYRHVYEYSQRPDKSAWSQILGGLYNEGTFMRLAEHRGAHNQAYFNRPTRELFDELQDAAGGLIRVVNVVPEWGDAALELIKYLSAKGIVCAAGHTGATGIQYGEAVGHGTTLAIHFPNGPTGSSVKPFDGGGAVETVLRDDRLFAEIIADGYHMDKSYARDTIRRKGYDKIVVITDSMFPALLDGVTEFSVFGVEGRVGPNGEYLHIADRKNALFGSSLTMNAAFGNVLDWLTSPIEGVWYRTHEPVGFEEALVRTSAMCSGNAARVLRMYGPGSGASAGMSDHTGSIEKGKCADLVIAGIHSVGGKHRVDINEVIVKGERVLLTGVN